MALTGTEVLQVTGADNLGRPSGSTETVTTLQLATFANSGIIPHFYLGAGYYSAAGNNQATATSITTDLAVLLVVGAGQGIVLPTPAIGADEVVTNLGLNTVTVYPAGTNTINSLAPGAGYLIPPGNSAQFIGLSATQWAGAVGNIPPGFVYNTNNAIGSTTLTASNLEGSLGFQDVTLALTGALTGAANATLCTATALISGINNPFIGQSWRLRVINQSSITNTWTVTTNSGWSLGGTMTIPQNTWRDYYVSITAAASAGLQNIGTGTWS